MYTLAITFNQNSLQVIIDAINAKYKLDITVEEFLANPAMQKQFESDNIGFHRVFAKDMAKDIKSGDACTNFAELRR